MRNHRLGGAIGEVGALEVLAAVAVLLHDQRDHLAMGPNPIEKMHDHVAQPLLRRSAAGLAQIFQIVGQYLFIA